LRAESPLWALTRTGTGRIVREGSAALRPPAPAETDLCYEELDLTRSADGRALWCYMKPKGNPSFTPTMLRELIAMRRAMQIHYSAPHRDVEAPRYFIGGSRLPQIFNLGGDLAYFLENIRSQDRDGLTQYAHDCVDVAYHMSTGFGLPTITIALVQGDALGGGFEGALSFNVVIAEKSARFGLPEVLFNLFPGMGAYHLIARKLNATRAEQMILSGTIYTAAELHEMGLIDVLAEDGQGEVAVQDYIARHDRQHAVLRSLREVRNRVLPLSLRSLKEVADIWVDHALQLDPSDLRRMERLRSAQGRRLAALPA
jgi:DSF synthase